MSSKKFVILGRDIPEGGGATLDLEVAKLHTRTPIKVPVIVQRAKKDGPVLLLMAGVHGDEVNGVAVIRQIIRLGLHKPKRGTIICIPVFNVFGYLIQTREFPDGRDLNRMFPGTSKGSLASQFAHLFTKEIAPLVDHVLDFHTGGAERENAAQLRCILSDDKALELSRAFGAPFIVNSKIRAKTLRQTLRKMGKTYLLFEGGKSKNLDNRIIDLGVNGSLNVMRHLGMQEGAEAPPKEPVVIKRSKWLRAPYSGMFQPMITNGSQVSKKQVLGVIQDPFGEFERKVLAPFDCHIFCVNTSPVINKGNALFHISVETV